jgi:hypothetical protein
VCYDAQTWLYHTQVSDFYLCLFTRDNQVFRIPSKHILFDEDEDLTLVLRGNEIRGRPGQFSDDTGSRPHVASRLWHHDVSKEVKNFKAGR